MATRARVSATLLLASFAAASVAQGESPAPPSPGKPPLCRNYREVMSAATFPLEAIVARVESGEVVIEFTITADDQVINVRAISATHLAFASAAELLVSKLDCTSWGKEAKVRVPIQYKVD